MENNAKHDPVEIALADWQRDHLDDLRASSFVPSALRDVTVVAYYFRTSDRLDSDFWRTEFALLKTFQTQGLLPAVLVVNERTETLEAFCRRHDVDLQIAANLVPGQLKTLALDLVENLHARFKTDYVLTVQDDGFPLRSGLGDFVGKFDYVGAPWERHMTVYDFYPGKCRVGNGGFSLRSRRLCEEASRLYRKWFRWMPYWWYVLGDDTFYCKTLRFWFPQIGRKFRWATVEEASSFSKENAAGMLEVKSLPLGFHGEVGWRNVRRLAVVAGLERCQTN